MSKDLDWSDVVADGERMRAEYEAREFLLHGMDPATVKFATHVFDDTGEAYDRTQTGYYRYIRGVKIAGGDWDQEVYTEVKDGDLVVVPRKGVYGFLYEAWPIAYIPEEKRNSIDDVNEASGELHALVGDTEEFFKSNPKYREVWEAAKQLYELHHESPIRKFDPYSNEDRINEIREADKAINDPYFDAMTSHQSVEPFPLDSGMDER
jgi:hypothetical protein